MPTIAVMDAIATRLAAGECAWGLQIADTTGLGTGTVYPILERLTQAGWITASWEAQQPSGRPRRRFYTITCAGQAEYERAKADRAQRHRKHSPGIGWAR